MSFQNAKLVCKDANPVDYLRQDVESGHPGYVVSTSVLKDILHCAARWQAGYQPPDSEAKTWGSLLDCRLLTPHQFAQRYAVKPAEYPDSKTGAPKPWNANATWCRAWRAEHQSRCVVSQKEVDRADTAVARLLADEILRVWHEASDRQVWLAGEWLDAKSGLVIPVRCLIDYLPRPDTEFAKCAGDLKTTRSGNRTVFQRQCYQMGWHIQAAFDLDLLVAATGQDRNTWCFIVQENYPPWQPCRRLLSQAFLEEGRQTYQRALAKYAKCLKTGRWPGYDDHPEAVQGWSLVEPEPWMSYEALEDRLEADQGEPEPMPESESEPIDIIP